MNTNVENFRSFLDSSHSVYHSVANLQILLQEAGYTCLSEQEEWNIAPGGKYYLLRNGSALLAFRIPTVDPKGFFISASHSDRPTFQLKENGVLTGKYTRLSTEKYGGMLMASWMDRPLSIAGRVVVDTPTGIQTKLVDIDRDLLLIPNVAIHMNRKANEGYAFNPAVDTLPLAGGEGAGEGFEVLLEEAAGGKILGRDLYLYLRQKAAVWGLQEEYLSGQALDDLACAWGCTKGFLAAEEKDRVPVLAVLDSEEIGSATYQGADSTWLSDVLGRIAKARDLDMDRMLAGSLLVSADNAHALHPNHPELSDSGNAPLPGGGVVVKFNASGRYTTTGLTAGLFRKICQGAKVPVQTYYNRADMPGGSTLGAISLTHVSVPSVDIGLAQLAMHSCYETMAVEDLDYLISAIAAFYSAQITLDGTGHWEIC